MQRALGSWITAGVALTGAGLIALTPAAPPLPDVQQRAVQLVVDPFPLVDWDGLVANTEADWNGLAEMFNQTTNLFTLPSSVLQDGLATVGTDLLEFKELWDPFGDAVLNPISALSLTLTSLVSLLDAPNAAIDAVSGIVSDFSQDFATLNFTNIWNDLIDAPSTIANAFLNGFPVAASSADPNVGTDYTLNAPSDLITPEFGLLTNPDAADTVASGTGNTVPLVTGTLAAYIQAEQTLADELQTVAGVAPATVDAPIVEGPNSVGLDLNFQNIWDDTGIPNSLTLNLGFTSVCLGIFSDSCTDASVAYNFSLDIPASANYSFDIPGFSIPSSEVPAYTYDISQTDAALLGSLGGLAAPATGTVGASDEVGNLLAPDGYINLAGPFDALLASTLSSLAAPFEALLAPVFGGLAGPLDTFITSVADNGFALDANAPVDVTNTIAETLNLLFTAL